MPEYHISDLRDLIWLCHRSFRLEVQDFLNTILGEDMMVTSGLLIESEVEKKLHKITEPEIGIRPPAENALKKLRVFSRAISLHRYAEHLLPFGLPYFWGNLST